MIFQIKMSNNQNFNVCYSILDPSYFSVELDIIYFFIYCFFVKKLYFNYFINIIIINFISSNYIDSNQLFLILLTLF